jgi:hypothetical protein
MVDCFVEYQSEAEDFGQIAAQERDWANRIPIAVIVWAPHNSFLVWIPFSEYKFTSASIILDLHLLGHNSHFWARNVNPADSHGSNACRKTLFDGIDRSSFKVLGFVLELFKTSFSEPLVRVPNNFISLLVVRTEISGSSQSSDLTGVKCVLTKLGTSTIKSLTLAGHVNWVLVTSLLVEKVVINYRSAPFLSILIPSIIALACLFFSLDLNPLQHFDSSY